MPGHPLHRPPHRPLACAALVALLAGCGESGQQQPAAAPPPPEVGVLAVEPRDVPITAILPGRLEASRVAEIRARATGIILERVFREGSDVRAGEVLFRIDPAPLQAALASARASLASAEATLAANRVRAERFAPLVTTSAVSRQDYDDAVAARDQSAAEVAAAAAAVESATLNLSYAEVTAPIAGRIGRAEVTEGALASQAEATLLARIQQIDPIYVNLTQPTSQLLALRQAIASGRYREAGEAGVVLLDGDGRELRPHGKLLFTDWSVDPGTAAVTLRAALPNPDQRLLPGMYVRASVTQAIAPGAVVVPAQAVLRAQAGAQGAQVLVVDDQGRAAARAVDVGPTLPGGVVITGGLAAGERLVVDGHMRVQPGAPVTAVPWPAPGSDEAAAAHGADASAGAAPDPGPSPER